MRICLIGGIYGKGGARTSYVKATPETTLEAGLRAAGHDVTTLSHYDDADFSEFDVVHVHHLSYGAARLASDPSGRPFVFTAHDASELNGIAPPLPRRLAMRYVLSRADAVVALSRAEADFHRTGAVVRTIPNGIESATFPCARRNRGAPPWKLLFAGQLIALKGCDLLLRALAELSRPFELSLAYQTDDLKGELEALASALGIAPRVAFLGKQDQQQLAALYQTHDLMILPSVTEALPSVITEAMLSGLPFVATNVGGIPEQAAGFGHLLSGRSPAALARAIRHVLDHYPKFADQGRAMGEHARATFSIEAMVGGHVHLYEQLAARETARRTGRTLLDGVVRAAVRHRGQRSPVAGSVATT